MSDWDQNEQFYKTDSEEFIRQLEEERNKQQTQDQVEEQKRTNNTISVKRGFNTEPSEKTCLIMTRNRPWIKCRIQPGGNTIYYAV